MKNPGFLLGTPIFVCIPLSNSYFLFYDKIRDLLLSLIKYLFKQENTERIESEVIAFQGTYWSYCKEAIVSANRNRKMSWRNKQLDKTKTNSWFKPWTQWLYNFDCGLCWWWMIVNKALYLLNSLYISHYFRQLQISASDKQVDLTIKIYTLMRNCSEFIVHNLCMLQGFNKSIVIFRSCKWKNWI